MVEEQDCCAGPLGVSARTPRARDTESPARPQSDTERLRSRRRVDPRVAIVVLALLNVIAFAAPSRWVILGAIAMDAVLLALCGWPMLALYWL